MSKISSWNFRKDIIPGSTDQSYLCIRYGKEFPTCASTIWPILNFLDWHRILLAGAAINYKRCEWHINLLALRMHFWEFNLDLLLICTDLHWKMKRNNNNMQFCLYWSIFDTYITWNTRRGWEKWRRNCILRVPQSWAEVQHVLVVRSDPRRIQPISCYPCCSGFVLVLESPELLWELGASVWLGHAGWELIIKQVQVSRENQALGFAPEKALEEANLVGFGPDSLEFERGLRRTDVSGSWLRRADASSGGIGGGGGAIGGGKIGGGLFALDWEFAREREWGC